MPISQQGAINTTALIVPDLYVQIVPPQTLLLNGVPTNIIGVIGTASWGPVGQPVIVSSMADYAKTFGPVMNRLYDMGTAVAAAIQQGAQNFRCVRVTDTTDTAGIAAIGASGTNPNNGIAIQFSSIFTGSASTYLTAYFGNGSANGTWRITLSRLGGATEIYDNMPTLGSNTLTWANFANVINGTVAVPVGSPNSGPSKLVFANGPAGAGTWTPIAPSAAVGTSGASNAGADGAAVTPAQVVGVDTIPRKGMFALRGQGCSIGVITDVTDSTQYTTQASFGLSEGIYMMLATPAGDTITNAVTTKGSAGLDSYSCKLLFGDWIWWNDQTNGVQRLISPQGFAAGRLANLSPEQSSLNKPLFSVVGSQKSGQPGTGPFTSYSAAELQALFQPGIDVIANPQPGGSYWGVRLGHNSSSNAATNGDNYTRMTNYIASTLAAGMGIYVGQVVNLSLFQRIRATLLSFLQGLLTQGLLGTTDGSLPFAVICDISNNPLIRTGLGYVQADVQIRYQAINEKFIVNIEGGQTVVVQRQTIPTGQT